MGLPGINIIFKTLAATAIERSAGGIVVVFLHDETEDGNPIEEFNSISDVDFSKFTERNYEYLKLIYAGVPSKVIVYRMKNNDKDYGKLLKKLENIKFNYLTIPCIAAEHVEIIATWIKEQRAKQKTFKAVLPKCTGDNPGIINFTTDKIKSTFSETVFSTTEYCARIAGVFAGLSLARSGTYYILNDIVEIETQDNVDALINSGQLVIIYDGEKHKIARAINSFTTFTKEKGKDLSKIKIIEGIDLYNDDIRSTFANGYVGKYVNDYDDKQLLVAAINGYNKALEGDVLDKHHENVTKIDLEAQKMYLKEKGVDVSKMSDINILRANTGSKVFYKGNLKFVDAMEDLDLVNYI